MQLPARIGKYELEEFLGGGMSHVYRARDTVIGRPVAVKILTEQGCEDTEVKARFLAEARMAGNLAHDNVLSIYDFGEDEQGHPFMVMELLRGQDLRQAIKNGDTGDLRAKLKIAIQTARALEYIHSQKIVHRDIKPENIHITTAGVVKLMDFGIAKTEGLAMTRAGYVLGTPFYMAPEQVMGENITEQVDVYAFGVLLFELLSGVKPITGDTVERIFFSILNEPLKLEPLQAAGVPQSLCDLVARCTAKKAAERPQGFGPVCAELERVAAELDAPTMMVEAPVFAPPVAEAKPVVKKPAWVLPLVLLVIAGLGAGLYFAMRPAPLPTTLTTPTGEMMLVPEGAFYAGENREHVTLPAFYIDKTEVTNQAYSEFCKATGKSLPEGFPQDKLDLPVVNVSILDALEFAKWAGKRLPSAREWEKAARGTDGRLYPWGDEDKAEGRANVGGGDLQPVGSFTAGVSPFGALDMVGNAWELVYELRKPSAEMVEYFKTRLTPPPNSGESWYMIRGLSFNEKFQPGAVYDSAPVPARWKNRDIGFRCAKDPK